MAHVASPRSVGKHLQRGASLNRASTCIHGRARARAHTHTPIQILPRCCRCKAPIRFLESRSQAGYDLVKRDCFLKAKREELREKRKREEKEGERACISKLPCEQVEADVSDLQKQVDPIWSGVTQAETAAGLLGAAGGRLGAAGGCWGLLGVTLHLLAGLVPNGHTLLMAACCDTADLFKS